MSDKESRRPQAAQPLKTSPRPDVGNRKPHRTDTVGVPSMSKKSATIMVNHNAKTGRSITEKTAKRHPATRKLNTTSGQPLKRTHLATRAARSRRPLRQLPGVTSQTIPSRTNLIWNGACLTYPATFRARGSLWHMNAELPHGDAGPDALDVRQRSRETIEMDRSLGPVGINRIEFNKPLFSHRHRLIFHHFYTRACVVARGWFSPLLQRPNR